MKKYLTIIALMGLLASCTPNGKYSISGKFDDFTGDSIYLMNQQANVLGAVASTDGSFTFTGDNALVPSLAMITCTREINENAEPFGQQCTLVLESGKMKMEKAHDDLYIMKGTKANNGYAGFMSALYEYYNNPANGSEILTNAIADGLRDNTDNFFGLFCLIQMFDPDDVESTRSFLDMFPENVRKCDIWIELDNQVTALSKFDIGKPYEPFSQEDQNGNLINSVDIINPTAYKYVLIDFWASWCGPCMSELPYLKTAYSKYSSKGFQILGVSLDRERESWINAIKDNEMDWIHVSDLKYWNNEVSRKYNIMSIPANLLIDCQTGMIVAKNLRGNNLETTLSPLFAN